MAAVSSPYGLKPYQLIGSQFNNNSAIREYLMTTNSSSAIFNGDVVILTAGQPAAAVTGTPLTLTPGTTAGVVGVCVGVRYVDPTMKYFINANFLPANAVTNGYTQIYVKVYEDPDALFLVQGNAQISATLATALSKIGSNATLTYTAGSTVTGNSGVALTSSTIQTAAGAAFCVRIVDFYWGQSAIASAPQGNTSATDLYPDIIVKWQQGMHAYYFTTGN
jgi:hypothetical protein